jgi:Lon protease-like protein
VSEAEEIALFPLGTVLFPGGPLPLRIFEPRYVELTRDCVRDDQPFGVCLIRSGTEAGAPAVPYATGTLARIVDWHQYEDGLLGITALGETRFNLLSTEVAPNGLVVGRIEKLQEARDVPLPDRYADIVPTLARLVERTGPLYAGVPADFRDAAWVGYRLAEVLPLEASARQVLLEEDDPLQRLAMLADALQRLEPSTASR